MNYAHHCSHCDRRWTHDGCDGNPYRNTCWECKKGGSWPAKNNYRFEDGFKAWARKVREESECPKS